MTDAGPEQETPSRLSLLRSETAIVLILALTMVGGLGIAELVSGEPAEPVMLEHIEPKVVIRVNSCPAGAFTVIRGVGERTAEAIIEARTSGGPFQSIDDLVKRVPRLKQSNIEDFAPYLDFSMEDVEPQRHEGAKKN